MKKGTGDDPFAEEEQEDEVEPLPEEQTENTVSESQSEDRPSEVSMEPQDTGSDLPYLAKRQLKNKSVKADRDQVPFFLRDSVQEGERTLRRDVEGILGQEIGKTDLREAAYVFAQRNPDGVADVLREWGVDYLD